VQVGGLGECYKLPSRDWGGAPAEIKFDAFWPENLASGGANFSFSMTFPKKIFSLTFP